MCHHVSLLACQLVHDIHHLFRDSPPITPSILLSRRLNELSAAINEAGESVKKIESAIRVAQITFTQTRQLIEHLASVRTVCPCLDTEWTICAFSNPVSLHPLLSIIGPVKSTSPILSLCRFPSLLVRLSNKSVLNDVPSPLLISRYVLTLCPIIFLQMWQVLSLVLVHFHSSWSFSAPRSLPLVHSLMLARGRKLQWDAVLRGTYSNTVYMRLFIGT